MNERSLGGGGGMDGIFFKNKILNFAGAFFLKLVDSNTEHCLA